MGSYMLLAVTNHITQNVSGAISNPGSRSSISTRWALIIQMDDFTIARAIHVLAVLLWIGGSSGFWMIWRADRSSRFADAHFWWMHAMIGVCLIFTVMLFNIEPLHLHRRVATSPSPTVDFAEMMRMHQ